jgi:hypothetical protein
MQITQSKGGTNVFKKMAAAQKEGSIAAKKHRMGFHTAADQTVV